MSICHVSTLYHIKSECFGCRIEECDQILPFLFQRKLTMKTSTTFCAITGANTDIERATSTKKHYFFLTIEIVELIVGMGSVFLLQVSLLLYRFGSKQVLHLQFDNFGIPTCIREHSNMI